MLLAVEVGVLVAVAISAQGEPTYGVVARTGSALVQASDQRNVVGQIMVTRAVSPVSGWLVAQADSGDGRPGAVIGSTWVPAGGSTNVAIVLDPRRPVPTHAYITLYADHGTAHMLDLPSSVTSGTSGDTGAAMTGMNADRFDVPIVADGRLVQAHPALSSVTFAVGPGQASISEASRTVDATSVVIPRVVAPAQSWVVVSIVATTPNQPAELLGATLVPQGTHANVFVPLDAAPGSRQVVATLHVDLGTLGQFDFSPLDLANSLDQPFVAGGQTVSAPVRLVR